MTDTTLLQADAVLSTLHELMQGSESDTARIQAAKILLERLAPRDEDDAARHEAEEREAALAEARGLLTEFAALRLAGLYRADAVAAAGAAEPDNAAAED